MQGRGQRRLHRRGVQGDLRLSLRLMSDTKTKTPPEKDGTAQPPEPEQTVCRRCGAPGPVGDDGFCAGCEKALEQACL